ncbi:MAG TPA: sigma-70 family RNA polymerase sigma factor [Thermoanaerobaculia bacterium]|nr:sigma-70 family RNA polymerase sigma factor [Thermoanaerobaculia bacterium]
MDLFAFDDLYVRRLKEHDRETEDHFDKYFRSLLFVKLRKRLPAQDIDDMTQDVFAGVLARLEELRDSRKLGAFVLGFCNNLLLERYRKESRTEPLNEVHEETIPGKSNTEAELLNEETAASVRHVLSSMRDRREADILRAIFLEDEDRDEICRRFDVDAQYLRVLLHRAKKDFKAAYRRKSKR